MSGDTRYRSPMIDIDGSADFAKLIKALSSDVVDAHIHWRLHCDLHEAIQTHPLVWAQSRSFWQLTLTAHAQTALGHLCRAFDQEQSALHLLSWLRTIRKNMHLFEKAEFKRRLAGNAFVDNLAESLIAPDLTMLESDINDCSATDPLVRKLIVHRGNIVAHTGAKRALSERAIPSEFTLSIADFESLLFRSRTVLNRYCHLWAAEVYSVSVVGRDDYKFIFSSVAAAVENS